MHDIEIKNMARMAIDACDRAYAPYSKYRVGACIKGESGAYYMGCNIENASYGLTMCAERVAIGKAISELEKRFTAVAVANDQMDYPMPCGACRQVLSEFSLPETNIIVVNGRGDYKVFTLGELLPFSFSLNDSTKGEKR